MGGSGPRSSELVRWPHLRRRLLSSLYGHGYTLQRAEKRSGFSFVDLSEAINKMKDEERAALKRFFEDTPSASASCAVVK